jgi:hypothetical protein
LSKQFYDRLGEDVANELVEWFNAVDATYRADLRELNELNFARFDAKLEQRLAEFNARLEERLARFEAGLERRLGERIARVEGRFGELDAKIDRVAVELKAKMEAVNAGIMAEMEKRFAQQTRWMFTAWTVLLVPIIGLWFR